MSDHRQAEPPPTADQVIETYLLRREEALRHLPIDTPEAARAALAVLSEFMRLYPYAATALENFAATESLIQNSPEVKVRTESEERSEKEAIVRRGMEAAARLLAARRMSAAPAEIAPLSGLRKEAEARGLTIQALASATRLSVPLLVKLDRRLIRFASIPRQAIERIGAELGRSFEAVAAYLQGGPQFASQASFRADAAPRMPDQQDFFDAVETDLTMDERLKAEWRRFKNAP
jgi:hypothetical protein